MKLFNLFFFIAGIAATSSGVGPSSRHGRLRVKSHSNNAPSFNMVSSLIIGSQAAVLIDLPMAIPQAKSLADWVRNTTDKPLVAAFTTHFHPDHYLSGAAFLSHFPEAKYYANSKTISQMLVEADKQVQTQSATYGAGNISQQPTIPTPYDFTFFTLPGDESFPIHLLSPLSGDTVDETLFWIPSIDTLIAGDTVFSHDVHVWLADLQTPALTDAWLDTLEYIEYLKPKCIVPGHSVSTAHFGPTIDLSYTQRYLRFWKQEIEPLGSNQLTPDQIFEKFNTSFPGPLSGSNTGTANAILNATAEQYGRGGKRQTEYLDLGQFNSTAAIEEWRFTD